MAPGGWGIGTPLDMQDEEFSNPSKGSRRRRRRVSSDVDEVAVSGETASRGAGYELEDSAAFAQRVARERNELKDAQRKELMNIARMAGIGQKPKVNADGNNDSNDSTRLGKFEEDILGDDDDLLDVRVEWNDKWGVHSRWLFSNSKMFHCEE